MQRYSTFRPTGFDTPGIGADRNGISDFLVVPCGLNRDSKALEQSNFATALDMLGSESDTVQVHRFDHWACGWFELILVDPADTARVAVAEEIEAKLDDYPILDESDFSDREWNEACEYWAQMSVSERVRYLQRAKQCIFAARRDELPQDDNGRLFELLSGV